MISLVSPGKNPSPGADFRKRFWPHQPHPARADLPGHGLRPCWYPEWHLQVIKAFSTACQCGHTVKLCIKCCSWIFIQYISGWKQLSVFIWPVTSLKMAQRSRRCLMRMTCFGSNSGTGTLLRCQRKCEQSYKEKGVLLLSSSLLH